MTKLDWNKDSADWPNRAASHFVNASGFRWHVQIMGAGPTLLLLHGTGSATHSWRGLLPLLARSFMVIAPDLPGHGFTDTPDRRQMSLPGMARAVGALLRALDATPEIAVGHSAGAAILVRMTLDRLIAPRLLVSLNGALLPLPSMPSELFTPLARAFASLPFVPQFAAKRASAKGAVERLLMRTGSVIDDEGLELYRKLISNPGHVAGALEMMASWNLRGLQRDLPRLDVPMLQIVGSNDRTIPPSDADRLQRILRIAGAEKLMIPGLGHLAHEQAPDLTAKLIREAAFP